MTVRDKKKYREAALKAWKTMKSRKREKATKDTQKITEFMSPAAMQKIEHPETSKYEETPEPVWTGNRIVVPFHKTPLNIGCGMFWELRWAYGCPLDCSYCYLRGTTRGKMNPQYVRIDHVLGALDEAFIKIPSPSIFNAGELSDALMNPQIMAQIVERFERQSKHKIYLLTKFGLRNVQFLLDNPRKQVICGWSINAPAVAKLWEKAAPSPEKRIEAAKQVSIAGYDTRIRIDPIFPIQDWESHYEKLLDLILSNLKPDRIILGTPRGLWKTIKYAKEACADMSWTRFFGEDSGWGKKLPFDQRKDIYELLCEKLDSLHYPLSRVSICKETEEMWNAMKLNFIPRLCNCYGKNALQP
jgi:spore photoproduct lyase